MSSESQSIQDIHKILAERGSRYGVFAQHARITQDMKGVMRLCPKWHNLADDQKEALDMIAHKIGRILNGDPDYLDSWVDIVGYTQLVIDRLKGVPEAHLNPSFWAINTDQSNNS
jgi:hypothetical protein